MHQLRTQSANELRQRDNEIRRLKVHLDAKQRGTTRQPSAATSNAPASVGTSANGETALVAAAAPEEAPRCDVEMEPAPLGSSRYCLSQESNDLLAQLCQNLSDENDKLMALIRSSLGRLRSLQGLRDTHVMDLISNEETKRPSSKSAMSDFSGVLQTLATDMDNVLEHLHRILTDPSFVPLEEVEIREAEIARLKKGLDKMEGQWKGAASTVDKWKAVVARGASPVDHDELRIDLCVSPIKAQTYIGIEGHPLLDEEMGAKKLELDAELPADERRDEETNVMHSMDEVLIDVDVNAAQSQPGNTTTKATEEQDGRSPEPSGDEASLIQPTSMVSSELTLPAQGSHDPMQPQLLPAAQTQVSLIITAP